MMFKINLVLSHGNLLIRTLIEHEEKEMQHLW